VGVICPLLGARDLVALSMVSRWGHALAHAATAHNPACPAVLRVPCPLPTSPFTLTTTHLAASIAHTHLTWPHLQVDVDITGWVHGKPGSGARLACSLGPSALHTQSKQQEHALTAEERSRHGIIAGNGDLTQHQHDDDSSSATTQQCTKMIRAGRVLLRKCEVHDFGVVDGTALRMFVMLGLAAHPNFISFRIVLLCFWYVVRCAF
jgi:hypothetical protein